MTAFIVSALVGVLCIILGISNMMGNINSLHSYHRQRVREEDRIPFGRLVGLGTIIIGIGVILMSGLSAVTVYTENEIYTWIGMGIMAVGFVVGSSIAFYGMIKYNKGIF